ncbi:MAG: MaoC family dehydratase N-terminal domain-containing protein [Bifidobacteriaceae bacterium]|jgi:acyl dehydratase|nr:MaoC family dehydratase N-terminal domain-containing protein [Bifidobacteriaceae bacterium]
MTPSTGPGRVAAVGDVIGQRHVTLTRDTLVRYAGASGDFNPIHYADEAARDAGLPGVIAHGMVTMGAAIDLVVDWAGDPGAVLTYEARFARPVVVPYPHGARLTVTGTITRIDRSAGTAEVTLAVTHEGTRMLAKSRATVRLGRRTHAGC